MSHHTEPVVTTAQGAVRGLRQGDTAAFLNIPYAAPPRGAGRFEPPQPHEPWDGVRDATVPGPNAPQSERRLGSVDMSPYFGTGWSRGEDYLTANVWTPAAANGDLPVMVFVHGGGFVAGSTRSALYDGSAFARDGVVLVTLNYRLGIAGFLDIPGAPANRGLLDVVAALRWVRENIAAFGGDPHNVTLFGQSAGATIVGGVLAAPEAA
ncbi:carboxylesterase family protein, partial [Streptomyces sp. NRRL S-15]